jgi:polysaccharide biosynthesis/export protein
MTHSVFRLALALALIVAPAGLAAQRPAVDRGDFHVGDRVLLNVEGEPALSDTFTVVAGPALDLPTIGVVSLAGVSHTDLQQYLSGVIGKYVRAPVVRTTTMVRLAVLGEVARPGFYSIPVQSQVSDALMAAGGPTATAQVSKAEIERDGQPAVSADSLSRGLASGLTLAQLGLRSGDQITVPAKGDPEKVVRMIGILVTIPVTILAIIRIL